jgi:hypothetical protein
VGSAVYTTEGDGLELGLPGLPSASGSWCAEREGSVCSPRQEQHKLGAVVVYGRCCHLTTVAALLWCRHDRLRLCAIFEGCTTWFRLRIAESDSREASVVLRPPSDWLVSGRVGVPIAGRTSLDELSKLWWIVRVLATNRAPSSCELEELWRVQRRCCLVKPCVTFVAGHVDVPRGGSGSGIGLKIGIISPCDGRTAK